MDWSILSKTLVEVLTQMVGKLAAELIRRLLPTEGEFPVPDDPQRLRSAVWNELRERAGKTRRPAVSRAVSAVMTRLNGPTLDRVWDDLYAAGVVPSGSSRFSTAGVVVQDFVNPVEEAAGLGLELLDTPDTRVVFGEVVDTLAVHDTSRWESEGGKSADDHPADRAGAVGPVSPPTETVVGNDAVGGVADSDVS